MDEKELMKLKEELERLKGENEALKAKAKTAYGKLAFKVSDKGGISVYGLGRFPTSLYLSQFDSLKASWADLCGWVEENRGKFTVKA